MKRTGTLLCCWRIGLLLPLLVLAACSDESTLLTDKLVVGEPFPDIAMLRLDGGTVPISQYRGKLVVLNVWATWCEPCRREMPNLQQLSDALDPEHIVVIGLSQDQDDHVVREYLLDQKVRFTSYIDPDGRLADDRLGIQIFPYTLLIAPDGHFIQRVAGPREWQRKQVVRLLEAAYAGDYSGLQ